MLRISAVLMVAALGATLCAFPQVAPVPTSSKTGLQRARWPHLRLTLSSRVVDVLTCRCALPHEASQSLLDAYSTYAAALDQLDSELGPRCEAVEAKIEAIRTRWKDKHYELQMQRIVPLDAPLDEEGMRLEVNAAGLENGLLTLQQSGMREVVKRAAEFSTACQLLAREEDQPHIDELVHIEMLRGECIGTGPVPLDFSQVFDPEEALIEAVAGNQEFAKAFGITACAIGGSRVAPRSAEARGAVTAAIARADASCARRLQRLSYASGGQHTSESIEPARRVFAAEAAEMIESALQSIDAVRAVIEQDVDLASANRWTEAALCKMVPSLSQRWFAEDGLAALLRESNATDSMQAKILPLTSAFQEQQRSTRIDAIKTFAKIYGEFGELGMRSARALRRLEEVTAILQQGDRQQDRLFDQLSSELGDIGPVILTHVFKQRARDNQNFELAERFRERVRAAPNVAAISSSAPDGAGTVEK